MNYFKAKKHIVKIKFETIYFDLFTLFAIVVIMLIEEKIL